MMNIFLITNFFPFFWLTFFWIGRWSCRWYICQWTLSNDSWRVVILWCLIQCKRLIFTICHLTLEQFLSLSSSFSLSQRIFFTWTLSAHDYFFHFHLLIHYHDCILSTFVCCSNSYVSFTLLYFIYCFNSCVFMDILKEKKNSQKYTFFFSVCSSQ